MTEFKYIGCSDDQAKWAGCDDPRNILEEGCDYEAERVDVHSWHTKIKLVGIKGNFNSVCFQALESSGGKESAGASVRIVRGNPQVGEKVVYVTEKWLSETEADLKHTKDLLANQDKRVDELEQELAHLNSIGRKVGEALKFIETWGSDNSVNWAWDIRAKATATITLTQSVGWVGGAESTHQDNKEG